MTLHIQELPSPGWRAPPSSLCGRGRQRWAQPGLISQARVYLPAETMMSTPPPASELQQPPPQALHYALANAQQVQIHQIGEDGQVQVVRTSCQSALVGGRGGEGWGHDQLSLRFWTPLTAWGSVLSFEMGSLFLHPSQPQMLTSWSDGARAKWTGFRRFKLMPKQQRWPSNFSFLQRNYFIAHAKSFPLEIR